MSYSGKFVLRLDSDFHENLAGRAGASGESLNQFCVRLLKEGLRAASSKPRWLISAKAVLPPLKKRFGKDLLAVAVFGSQVQGRATAQSDLDLLIVLKESVPIQRDLYLWWEEILPKNNDMELNPHFVTRPQRSSEPSGFWLEIALGSEILYEKKKDLTRWLSRLKQLIDDGEVSRRWSNGHPYWILQKKRAS